MQPQVMDFLYLRQKILQVDPQAGSTWSSSHMSGPTLPQTLGFNP